MNQLSDRGRALVEAAREARPTEADRARVRAAIVGRLAAGVPSPGAPPALSAAHAKIAAGMLIGAIGFAAGVAAPRAEGQRPDFARHGVEVEALRRAIVSRPAAVERAAVAVATTLPPPERVAERVALARHATRSLPRTPPAEVMAAEAPAPPRRTSTLGEETELLRKAESLLQRGDAVAALAALAELRDRHPDGLLREERLAAQVVSLCAAGRSGEARREAESFLTELPLSIDAARVRAACATGTKGGPR